MASVGSGLVNASSRNGPASMYSDRVTLSHITGDPNLGQEKVPHSLISVPNQGGWSPLKALPLTHISFPLNGQPVYFSVKAYVSFIKPDQTMWYRACKTCNKKVTEAVESGFWCEGCQKNDAECSLR